MKHKNFILSVLFWAVASMSMAVTLPTTSYSGGFFNGVERNDVQLGTGARMYATLSTSSTPDPNSCTVEGQAQDENTCSTCCTNSVEDPCFAMLGTVPGLTPDDCGSLKKTCLESCTSGSRSLPLGTPLLLLPFALVYALVRRKRNVVE